jgi:signal peptidase I
MAARFLAFGASPKRVDAPADGEVFVPVGGASSALMVPFENVPGRKWLVIPTTLKEYTLFVDRTPVKLRVPADFDFEWAVRDAFFATDAPSRESAKSDLAQVALRRGVVRDERGQIYLATGKKVRTGERVMAFDILTGDNLFVDRVTYHFAQPEVGSGFVFRTGNIEGIRGISGDQYYIKRLVGVPGDKLQIKGTGLIRNGAPIEGSEAFAANAQQAGNYPGYRAAGRLEAGRILEIPPRSYFAMGDNSPNSADGREWGFVPAKDVVGRPLLVYYPFTRHWGPAR